MAVSASTLTRNRLTGRVKYREMNRNSSNLEIDDLVLDLERQCVWREGQRIELPGLSFRLLEVLVREAPGVVSRKELRRMVWGDVVVSDDAIRQRVRLLRQSLGSADYIATVKGIGYRVARPVTRIPRKAQWQRPWLLAAAIAVTLASTALLGSDLVHDLRHIIIHALKH